MGIAIKKDLIYLLFNPKSWPLIINPQKVHLLTQCPSLNLSIPQEFVNLFLRSTIIDTFSHSKLNLLWLHISFVVFQHEVSCFIIWTQNQEAIPLIELFLDVFVIFITKIFKFTFLHLYLLSNIIVLVVSVVPIRENLISRDLNIPLPSFINQALKPTSFIQIHFLIINVNIEFKI